MYPSPRNTSPPGTELRIFLILLVVGPFAGTVPGDDAVVAAPGVESGWDCVGVEDENEAGVSVGGGGGLIGAALGVAGAVAILRMLLLLVLGIEDGMWLRKIGRRARSLRRQDVQSILRQEVGGWVGEMIGPRNIMSAVGCGIDKCSFARR